MKQVSRVAAIVFGLVLGVISQLKPDTTAACKLAYVFGAQGKVSPPQDHGPNKTFCKSINKTCCSDEDFKMMWKKWQDNTTSINNTIRGIRITEFQDLLNLTKYLGDAEENVTKISNVLKSTKSSGDPACMTPAHVQANMASLELVRVALIQFNLTAKTCWNYTQNLMNALMCATCDANVQDFIDTNLKAFTISNSECSRFIGSCGEHIKAIHAVYFYYNVYYRLTFCSNKAEFNLRTVPLMMNFPLQTMRAIDGCLNIKNPDDCAEVCRTQLGFSTMVNYEYQNKKSLNLFNEAIKNYTLNFKPPNTTVNNTEPIIKRRRRVLPNNAVEELNQYKVTVRRFGLNFDQYTRNNLDGYDEITLKEIFAGNIFAVAGAAMFVLLVASF